MRPTVPLGDWEHQTCRECGHANRSHLADLADVVFAACRECGCLEAGDGSRHEERCRLWLEAEAVHREASRVTVAQP